MHCLMIGMHSEECVVRLFHCCANIIENTYTNLDGGAYYTAKLYSTAYRCSWAITCTIPYRAKEQKTESSTRDSDAIKWHNV